MPSESAACLTVNAQSTYEHLILYYPTFNRGIKVSTEGDLDSINR